jgi:SAM-dependent methyltransferase
MHEEERKRLKQAYADDIAARERKSLSSWREENRRAFLRRLRQADTPSLLEIGSGVGKDAVFFSEAGISVTCIDLTPEMVQHCQSKGLCAEVMDAVDLSFQDEVFGAVYCVNSLLHLTKPEFVMALEEVRRVLRPNGLFFYGTWGGFCHEGVYEDDPLTPPRWFSLYDDETLQRILGQFFDILAFDSGARNPEGPRFLFQTSLLQKPSRATLEARSRGRPSYGTEGTCGDIQPC